MRGASPPRTPQQDQRKIEDALDPTLFQEFLFGTGKYLSNIVKQCANRVAIRDRHPQIIIHDFVWTQEACQTAVLKIIHHHPRIGPPASKKQTALDACWIRRNSSTAF